MNLEHQNPNIMLSSLPRLDPEIEGIKIPFRFGLDMSFRHAEVQITQWLESQKSHEDVLLSEQLCYILNNRKLTVEPLKLSTALMCSFFAQIVKNEKEDLTEICNMEKILKYCQTNPSHTAYFLVFTSYIDGTTHHYDSWFNDYRIVICPCLFLEYITYTAIHPDGVTLAKLNRFANANKVLDDIGLDWKSFNKNMIENPPDYYKEANKLASKMCSVSQNFWEENVYECGKSSLWHPPSISNMFEADSLQTLTEAVGLGGQKRLLADSQDPEEITQIRVRRRTEKSKQPLLQNQVNCVDTQEYMEAIQIPNPRLILKGKRKKIVDA